MQFFAAGYIFVLHPQTTAVTRVQEVFQKMLNVLLLRTIEIEWKCLGDFVYYVNKWCLASKHFLKQFLKHIPKH